jgi:hypothetical protein
MSQYFRSWKADFHNRRSLANGVFLAILAGLLGPLSSFECCGLVPRVEIWMTIIGAMMVLRTTVRVTLRAVCNYHFGSWNILLVAGIVCILMVYPMSAVATEFWSSPSSSHGYSDIAFFLFVTALGLGANSGSSEQPEPSETTPAPRIAPRLVQRLGPDLQGELLAITVRDHYVNVVTTAGTASLLLRLCDAVAEAEGVPGAQVHRSHWVAWSAVTGIEREGARVYLRLNHDLRIPVSRNHRAILIERGLL